jgi:hypothetical protein
MKTLIYFLLWIKSYRGDTITITPSSGVIARSPEQSKIILKQYELTKTIILTEHTPTTNFTANTKLGCHMDNNNTAYIEMRKHFRKIIADNLSPYEKLAARKSNLNTPK